MVQTTDKLPSKSRKLQYVTNRAQLIKLLAKRSTQCSRCNFSPVPHKTSSVCAIQHNNVALCSLLLQCQYSSCTIDCQVYITVHYQYSSCTIDCQVYITVHYQYSSCTMNVSSWVILTYPILTGQYTATDTCTRKQITAIYCRQWPFTTCAGTN